ncbi:hypothetical protein [Sinomonas gamaensis]|uniref:hypothetical protein n=1 Tax=Sinomonas gamaensis TaxID=2565624 RepID=UPI001109A980|nr:hypothetical protein [Sinomonas gamaensis]
MTALASLLFTSLVIHHSGSQVFGFVMLIASLFMLVPFADLGVGASVVNAVAVSSRSDAEMRVARAVVRKAMKVLSLSALSLLAVGGAVSLGGLWSRLLNVPLTPGFQQWIPTLAILPFALALPLSVGNRILIGAGANHTATVIGVLGPVGSLAVTAILIQADVDPLVYSVGPSTGVLISSALAYFLGTKRLNWPLWERGFGLPRVTLRGAAVPMFIISIAVPLGVQLQRYFVSNLASSDLAQYALAAQLYFPCYSVISNGSISLWPIFASDRRAAAEAWTKAFGLMASIGILAFAGYVLFAPLLANVVSGGKIHVGTGLLVAFGALLLVMAAHQPAGMFLTWDAALRIQALCSVFALALIACISLVTVPVFGTPSAVWATVIGVGLAQLVPGIALVLRHIRKDARREISHSL